MATKARAHVIARAGSLAQTLEQRDVELPALGADEVRVRVAYAALNPVDYKIAALLPGFLQKLPRVPASDFSGTVDAVGASIDSLKPGTRVYGFVPAEDLARGKNGALATFVNVPRKFVLPAPAHLSDEELGGVTLVGLTALTLAATLRQGDRVLIVGGSTAVGLLAADVARAKGASLIVASASGAKAKFIKERGVDETIDYREVDVAGELALRYKNEPFDVAWDCIGDASIHAKSPAYLKPDGEYRTVGATGIVPETGIFSTKVLGLVGFQLKARVLPSFLGGIPRKFSMLHLDKTLFPELQRLVDSGKIRPVVDRTFAFDEARDAYAYLIDGRALGKVNVAAARS